MNKRQVMLWDDWSKGANTTDRLLPQGVSAKIENFDCFRNGTLRKTKPPLDIAWSAYTGWDSHFTNAYRVCYYYANDKDYLVVLGDIGLDAVIAVWNGTGWVSYPASEGYFEWDSPNSDLEDVIFVSSIVGGVPCLRVYPIYPSDTAKEEWIPLRIFFFKATNYWTRMAMEEVEAALSPPSFYRCAVFDGNRVECACDDHGGGGAGELQPCVNNGGYYSGCPALNQNDRIDFSTNYYDGNIFICGYREDGESSNVGSNIYMAATVLSRTASQVIVKQGISRSPMQDNSANEVGKMLRIDDARNFTAQAEGIRCVRGLPGGPIYDKPIVSLITFISEPQETSQASIPQGQHDCKYEGGETIRYGFAFRSLDGQIGEMTKTAYTIEDDFVAEGTFDAKGFVQLSISLAIFNNPSSSTGAEKALDESIVDLIVFRKNNTDGEWKVLGIVERCKDDVDVYPLISQETTMYFTGTYPGFSWDGREFNNKELKEGAYMFQATLIDSGQALSENVYSFSGGLEEEKLGYQYCPAAPAVYGRKIYAGSVLEVDPIGGGEWMDDLILPSLFDFGESFNLEEHLGVAAGESDKIMHLVFFGRQMIVFKKSRVVVVELIGTQEGSWRKVGEFNGGVVSRDHVYETTLGPVWLTDDGMYLWSGEKKIPLSTSFEDEYKAFYEAYPSTAIVGYDNHTGKIYLTRVGGGEFAWVINLKHGGTLQTVQNAVDFEYRTFNKDLTGRLTGLTEARTIRYAEAKDSELGVDDYDIGSSIWNSGEIDLANLVGDGKIYKISTYISYKRDSTYTGTHTIYVKVRFDGGSQITYSHDLPAGVQEDTIELETYVWDQGSVVDIEIDTNELPSEPRLFQVFDIWKVAGSFRSRDVD